MTDVERATELLLHVIKREADRTGELDVCELLVAARELRKQVADIAQRRRLIG